MHVSMPTSDLKAGKLVAANVWMYADGVRQDSGVAGMCVGKPIHAIKPCTASATRARQQQGTIPVSSQQALLKSYFCFCIVMPGCADATWLICKAFRTRLQGSYTYGIHHGIAHATNTTQSYSRLALSQCLEASNISKGSGL